MDSTGAVIPGIAAEVRLVNLKSENTQELKVNERGGFSTEVIPGRYRLDVQVAGFKSYSKKPLDLRPGTAVHATITMAVGSMGGSA